MLFDGGTRLHGFGGKVPEQRGDGGRMGAIDCFRVFSAGKLPAIATHIA